MAESRRDMNPSDEALRVTRYPPLQRDVTGDGESLPAARRARHRGQNINGFLSVAC